MNNSTNRFSVHTHARDLVAYWDRSTESETAIDGDLVEDYPLSISGNISNLSRHDAINLHVLLFHFEKMYRYWQAVNPAIHILNFDLSSKYRDHFVEGHMAYTSVLASLQTEIERMK